LHLIQAIEKLAEQCEVLTSNKQNANISGGGHIRLYCLCKRCKYGKRSFPSHTIPIAFVPIAIGRAHAEVYRGRKTLSRTKKPTR